MNKKQEIQYHLIFWILFILMEIFSDIVFKNNLDSFNLYLLHNIEFLFLQISFFYIVYLWLAPKYIPQKKWGSLVLGLAGILLLFAGMRYFLEEVLLYSITGYHNYYPNSLRPLYYIFDNSYYAFRIFLLALVFYFVKHLLTTKQEINQLKLKKKQAELRALKSQLSPHFLFNTLNSFYADALEVNSKLSDDILKLSEMLRYVTYENENDFVLLKDELHFLNNYITLFQRRLDGNLVIQTAFPKQPNKYKVPALLLLHFVENAFKHGILDAKEQPIKLSIAIIEGRLIFKISNAFESSQRFDARGIGYKNIQKRLEILFKKSYTLEHLQEENRYFVSLEIPLQK